MSRVEVDRLLADHTPPIQAITEALRRLILMAVPGAEERIYTGWHALGYVDPRAGYFAGIFPRSEVVKLCFEWGAHLPDPEGVLTGNQKRIRYVEIEDETDIPEHAIKALLQEAISFQLAMK